jgi:hypothetical protein
LLPAKAAPRSSLISNSNLEFPHMITKRA